MPIIKTVEPLYNKTRSGIAKAGYQVVKIVTNKNGVVIKSVIERTKIYKY